MRNLYKFNNLFFLILFSAQIHSILNKNSISFLENTQWINNVKISERIIDLAEVEGDLWGVGENGLVYKYSNKVNELINSNEITKNKIENVIRISIGKKDEPWVCKSNGEIWRLMNDNWERIRGCCKDIAIGDSGSAVYKVACKPLGEHDGNFLIETLNPKDFWVPLDEAGVRICTFNKGKPYIVQKNGTIMKFEQGKFVNVGNKAYKAIDVGCGKYLYYISEKNVVYKLDKWDTGESTIIPGPTATSISGSDNATWVVDNNSGQPFRLNENKT